MNSVRDKLICLSKEINPETLCCLPETKAIVRNKVDEELWTLVFSIVGHDVKDNICGELCEIG